MKSSKSFLLRFFSVILMFSVAVSLAACKEEEKKLYLFDSEGNAFAEFGEQFGVNDMSLSAFAGVALNEATEIIAEKKKITSEKALAFLKNGYMIETTLNSGISSKALEKFNESVINNSGFAVTDLYGNVLAIGSSDTATDYADTPTYAGSTVKPLSVYAPCMEKGLLNWSSMQVDEPIKFIEETGNYWPMNADGKYSEKNITVCEAVEKSVNTVAVKWLQKLGVENSIDFLEKSFGMDLSLEKQIAKQTSSDEILGDIGLGYLKSGVTVLDMSGYYTIFANGGMYYKTHTVTRIISESGNVIYEHKDSGKRVLSLQTATVMNYMLQNVVSGAGTGAAARVEGVNIGGKTGTTDQNADNWFAGFSPEYSCAVWHDNSSAAENTSPQIFKKIMESFIVDKTKKYPACDTVERKVYCLDSGMLLTDNCKKMEMGFFSKKDTPRDCTRCK